MRGWVGGDTQGKQGGGKGKTNEGAKLLRQKNFCACLFLAVCFSFYAS